MRDAVEKNDGLFWLCGIIVYRMRLIGGKKVLSWAVMLRKSPFLRRREFSGARSPPLRFNFSIIHKGQDAGCNLIPVCAGIMEFGIFTRFNNESYKALFLQYSF